VSGCEYSKDELVVMATQHFSTEVRLEAARLLYLQGVTDGLRQALPLDAMAPRAAGPDVAPRAAAVSL
jgi:hypothetical protein